MRVGDTARPRRLLRYLGYAASAALVGWLLLVILPDLGDLDEAGELLVAHIRLADVGVAGALLGIYLVTHGLTVSTAAPGLALGAAIRARAVAGGIARFVPAGWAAGTGVLVTMLRSRGIRPTGIAHALAVTSVWNTVTKLLLPLLGLVAVAAFGTSPLARGWEVAAIAVAGIVTVIVLLRLLGRPRTARLVARMVQRPLSALARAFARPEPLGLPERAVVLQASTGQALRDRPLAMALWYMGHHLTHVALVYLGMHIAARGAGLQVGWAEVLAAFAVGYLLTGLPISPAGLGTTDVVVVALLTGLGEQAAVASAGLATYRLTTYGLHVAALASWPFWRPAPQPDHAAPADEG